MPKKKQSEKLDPAKYSHFRVEAKCAGRWCMLVNPFDSMDAARKEFLAYKNDPDYPPMRIVRVTVSAVEVVG